MEELGYLGVLLKSIRERWSLRLTGKLVHRLQCSLCTSYGEERLKARLSYYWSMYVPTLTNGLWVMTDTIGFLRRVSGCTLRDSVKSSVTWEGLGVELLLLLIEKDQLRSLGHLLWMPCLLDTSLGRCFSHVPLGGGLEGIRLSPAKTRS